MSAAAPRTISNAPDLRLIGAAVGALILAVVLVVAVTLSRPASISPAAPLAAPAPVFHDQHEWNTSTAPGLVVRGTQGGGIQYTGIPYAAPDSTSISGGRGTRFAR